MKWMSFVSMLLVVSPMALGQPVLITAPQTVGPQQTEIIPTAGGDPVPLATAEITVRGTTLTMNGRHQIASLVVEPNGATVGVVTHSNAFSFDYAGDGSDVVNGLDLSVANDVLIAANGRIDVSGRGFGAGQGPGAGRVIFGSPYDSATGGGHGGEGGRGDRGRNGGLSYGNMQFPETLGSGGGSADLVAGGAGGGRVHIQTDGDLILDGIINANGLNGSGNIGNGGGGSGGSVLLFARSLTGKGQISANGGNARNDGGGAGGGGGGRIAVYSCGVYDADYSISVSGGAGWEDGQPGTIFYGDVFVEATSQSSAGCSGGSMMLQARVQGTEASGLQWFYDGELLLDGDAPWGSVISGSQTDSLSISNIQPQDAGLYTVIATTDCGIAESNAVAIDVYCDCEPTVLTGGIDDNFALPRELTSPSTDLLRVLLERRPGRPFHEFDQIPVVTTGVESDSRLAHSFTGLPADIVSARLTMRVQAGGSGNNTIIAEGTDSIRLGFTTAQSTAASNDDRVWERRFGDLPGEPAGLFDAGQIWTRGDARLFTLDLAALPVTARLGEIDPDPLSLIDQLNAKGFLDVTVVDETGVDFMLLEVETSDGRVVAWAGGSTGTQTVTGGSRAELFATGGDLGGPFTFQWWREGSPISLTTNPTAQSATLIIDPATGADMGEYECLVSGQNTCDGPVFTQPVTLVVEPLCPADVNADAVLDFFDILIFVGWLADDDLQADWNDDGVLDFFDVIAYVGEFDAGCP